VVLDPLRIKAVDGQSSREVSGEPLRWNTELPPYAMVPTSEAKPDLERDVSEF
jgi:hypothetical protein